MRPGGVGGGAASGLVSRRMTGGGPNGREELTLLAWLDDLESDGVADEALGARARAASPLPATVKPCCSQETTVEAGSR